MGVERIEVKADAETIAGWQSHFNEPLKNDPKWMTSAELSKALGIGQRVMRERLKKGVDAGTFQMQMAYRMRTDGRPALVPVYQMVKLKRKQAPKRKRGK